MHHKQCYLCSSKNYLILKGYEKHKLAKCNTCGFVFMLRVPTSNELTSHYKKYSYGVDSQKKISPLTEKSFNKLLDYFEKYRINNTILDVGCGRGYLLEIAKLRGWSVYGTEFSEEAADICKRKGIAMHHGTLSKDIFKDIEFDVIVSLEVIEHINNPNQDLEIINSKLRKGGLFYITTPNFNGYLRYQLKSDYNIIEYPEHLSYYTRSTLNKVLLKNKFKKIKMKTTGVSITRKEQSKKTTKAKVEENTSLPKISSDEKLRKMMTKNKLMIFIKYCVNKILSVTGLGLTLKGYYTK